MRAPVAIAVAVLVSGARACPPPDHWSHLQWARALVASVGDDNQYAHRSAVRFPGDGAGAAVDADCSGLVNALLRHAYGLTPAELSSWLGAKRPRAREYFDSINAGRGFRRIDRAQDVRPGDLIATRLPEGSKDTGHLMIAAGPARERTPSEPLVAGARQWEIDIIDSTGTPHGPTDTRRRAGAPHATGIGRGVLRLYTGADGTLTGYTWSPAPKNAYRSREDHGLAVGRIIIKDEWLLRRDLPPVVERAE